MNRISSSLPPAQPLTEDEDRFTISDEKLEDIVERLNGLSPQDRQHALSQLSNEKTDVIQRLAKMTIPGFLGIAIRKAAQEQREKIGNITKLMQTAKTSSDQAHEQQLKKIRGARSQINALILLAPRGWITDLPSAQRQCIHDKLGGSGDQEYVDCITDELAIDKSNSS